MADEATKMAEEERAAATAAAEALAPPAPPAEEKPPVSTTPEMDLMASAAPALMAELMREFIQKKDLNARAQMRLRMKALLDLFSVDTSYPPVPALNPDQQGARAEPAVGFGQVAGGAFAPGRPEYVVGRPPAPRFPVPPRPPGADQIREAVEQEIAREIGDGVQAVPGAEAAPPPPGNDAVLQ